MGMNLLQSLYILTSCNLFSLSFGVYHYMLFRENKTRDEAQLCCQRMGMAQLEIESQWHSDIYRSYFSSFSGVSEMWLGLFHANGSLTWSNGQPVAWTNFDIDTTDLIEQGNVTGFCVKANIKQGLYWTTGSCGEALPYSCNTDSKSAFFPLSVDDAICPKHKKFSGGLARKGNTVGKSKAGNYGTFTMQKNDMIPTGKNLESITVTYMEDCFLYCLSNTECSNIVYIKDYSTCILQTD